MKLSLLEKWDYIIQIIGIIILISMLCYLAFKNRVYGLLESFENNIQFDNQIALDTNDEPIDFVYTWVASYDPERNEYKRKLGLSEDNNSATLNRFKDSNELKYSLRSIFQNCPWFNRIYIVVKDGQKPDFIDFSDSRIILVNHSEIMPEDALPTFNSNAIEYCLHHIPNLSNKYIYMNDDLFILKQLSKRDFYKNGAPVISMKNFQYRKLEPLDEDKLNGEYDFVSMILNTLYQTQQILGEPYYMHMAHYPSACIKKWDYEIENLLQNRGVWENTVYSKFRNNSNIILNNIFRNLYYRKKHKYITAMWSDNLNKMTTDCNLYTLQDKTILAINEISELCADKFTSFMESRFPTPATWEL